MTSDTEKSMGDKNLLIFLLKKKKEEKDIILLLYNCIMSLLELWTLPLLCSVRLVDL